MTVLGDISAREITPQARKAAGDWKGAGSSRRRCRCRRPPRGRSVILVNRPNSVQTAFYVGNHAIDRLSPDYIPVQVMNRVLGGGPASRLFRNIREEKGYTYGISSGFSASRYMNHFASQTSVRTEVTGRRAAELLKEFADIRDRPVPADELENAKRALVAIFALSTESPAAALSLATQIKEYGLPADYWDTYPREDRGGDRGGRASAWPRSTSRSTTSSIIAVGDATKIRDVADEVRDDRGVGCGGAQSRRELEGRRAMQTAKCKMQNANITWLATNGANGTAPFTPPPRHCSVCAF